jgi:hypothetical protein
MHQYYFGPVLAVAVSMAVLVATAQAQQKAPQTDAELIASAMAAEPKNVAEDATIVAMDDKGGMRTLRKGSNGFTCMPDNLTTPGVDPMCLDADAMKGRTRG